MVKNKSKLTGNCDAASDMIGALLLTSIAVLAFSTASVFVLSTYQGATDTPHVDVDGWVDVESDVITLRHSGGEIVDSDNIKIILDVNGTRRELSPEQVRSIMSSDTWRLGDTININTSSLWSTNISENDYVGAAIVHTASSVVMKSGTLLGVEGQNSPGNDNGSEEPPTPPSTQIFTPISVIDQSEGTATVENVSTYDDSSYTRYNKASDDFDTDRFQQFNFSPSLDTMPTTVSILIRHNSHANSGGTRIRISTSPNWDSAHIEGINTTNHWINDTVDVSGYMQTLDDINNLKIRYESYKPGSPQYANIDYVILIVDY